jgi:hypothetical protein
MEHSFLRQTYLRKLPQFYVNVLQYLMQYLMQYLIKSAGGVFKVPNILHNLHKLK